MNLNDDELAILENALKSWIFRHLEADIGSTEGFMRKEKILLINIVSARIRLKRKREEG